MSANQVKEIFETMDYGVAMEDRSEADKWLKSHSKGFKHFIGGKWIDAGEEFKINNPENGEILGKAKAADKEVIDMAVTSAQAGLKTWQGLSCFERAKYLYAIARLIQKNARLFAVLESLDNGKSIRETRDADIPTAIRHFYYHAGMAQILDKEFKDYEAIGIVGQIIPWNFPFLMLAWKIAPAIAAGNAVILKPAEETPLTSILFAEICVEAGIPDGVINIVQGDGVTGGLITEHKDIKKIAFTGSTEIGKLIRKNTAGTGKTLTLELGGKSPFIIFDDADIDSAVEGIVDSIWFNQGEVCCAGSRLLVQEGVKDKVITKLTTRMNKLRLGSPLDKTIDMGTVVNDTQLKRITDMVNDAVKDGATIIQLENCPDKGCYYRPTILTDVYSSSAIVNNEIFGPVLTVQSFRSPDEAVELANNSKYGLAANIWSDNINMALDVAPKIKSGVVWINSANLFDASCGFGGYKESGFGREGGFEGMYAYLKPRYLSKLKPAKEITTITKTGKLDNNQIDETAKMYIGGKQARPDGNYNMDILNPKGLLVGEVGLGSRKDIRNAVEAAKSAYKSWNNSAHHLRAQIIYYIAENLDKRSDEFAKRIVDMTGCSAKDAKLEVETSIKRIFSYGAYCDKFEGRVHTPPMKAIAIAMQESIGAIGMICPNENPLLGFISLVMPAIAMGNTAIIIPSEQYSLSATDFYQILECSDLPAGVINIVTGNHSDLIKTLAEHDNLDALWCFSNDKKLSQITEELSIGNLKQTWVNNGMERNLFNEDEYLEKEYLMHSTQVKNIWVPYGEQI